MNVLSILTAASGSLQVAAGEEPPDPAAIARYTMLIEQHAFRSAQLVQMLQNYGVVGVSRPAVTSVRAILRDTLALVERHFAQEAGVHILVQWPAAPRSIVCDHSAVVHMLVNLLANARDALAPQGGTVELGCLPCSGATVVSPCIHLTCPKSPRNKSPSTLATMGRYPAALLEAIFDPFFSTKAGNGHSGLGLTTAQRIAQEHHGRLAASNNLPAPGATFVAILPPRPPAS